MNWISIPGRISRSYEWLSSETLQRYQWFEALVYCIENDLHGRFPVRSGIEESPLIRREGNEFVLWLGQEIYKHSARTSYREGAGAHRTRRYRRMVAARKIATHTDEEWQALLTSFGGLCLACGSENLIQKDHVRAVVNGGSDGLDNLQPLCRSCNCRKKDKTIDYRSAR